MTHGPPARRKQTNLNTINSDDDDDAIVDNLPIPPDGGWGWVVAFASFMIHIVTDGITYSFGIFHNTFVDHFNEGTGYTAWIASILVGVTLCSGPISSSFVNRYGCRVVTIAGAILASACIVLSIFATNVLTLIFTLGIGTGFGFGLIYLPAIVSVTMYFEKYRSLATGIAVCGSGLGTFIFAPLTDILIREYGWRGALLILAGIVLNCICFGAMFRPLLQQSSNNSNNQHKNIDDNNKHSINMTELQPLRQKNNDSKKNILEIPERIEQPIGRSHSIGFGMGNNTNQTHNGHLKSHNKYNHGQHKSSIRATVSQPHISSETNNMMSIQFHDHNKDKTGSGTMYRPDILYQGSLVNIADYRRRSEVSASGGGGGGASGHQNRNELTHYGSLRREKRNTDVKNDEKISDLCGCIPCSKETSDAFNEMMDFSLFRDVIFIIFTLSNFCTSIGFNIPYIYLVARAESLNFTKEEASYLISIIGIANTIGRIILGYLSDKPWVNRLMVYNVCLTVCGIVTALSIYCETFISLAIYASIFGFTIGAYVGLTSVILVDLLGLDKLTNAFGLLLLFQGIASLVGPPFAGWLFDILHSYNPGFLLAGGTIAVSGIILFAIPFVQKHQNRRQTAFNLNQNQHQHSRASENVLSIS